MPIERLVVALVAPEGEEQRLSARALLGNLPPEPNRSADGRSSSGPLVRGPEPNRSAEGRSSSGPLVRGFELVEAAAMRGARREGKRRLRRGR